jgi:RND family efflux transporter MFP subunit
MKRLFACFFMAYSFVAAAEEKHQAPAVQVVTETVQMSDVAKTRTVQGRIDFEVASLSCEVNGLVSVINVKDGDSVSKGEVLAELDTELLQAEHRTLTLEIAEKNVAIAKNHKNLQRYEKLLKNNAATEFDYDEYYFTDKSLAAERTVLEGRLKSIEIQLAKSKIMSPVDGIVVERIVELGEWAGPGTVLFRVASKYGVVAELPVSENNFPFIKDMKEMDVLVEPLKRTVKGQVVGLVPETDLRSRSFLLRVSIPWEPSFLQNMTVSGSIPVSEKKQMVLIPRPALVRFNGMQFVYTVQEGGAQPLPVQEIAAYMGKYFAVEVGGPFKEGLKVIVDGNERLRPGQKVQSGSEKH